MRGVHSLILGAVLAGTTGGCAVRAAGTYTAEPEMVYLDDNVYVLADYPEPVFYSEGLYWRYYGGVWYRSRVHTGSWVRVHQVPRQIVRIDRPQTYVRYRPGHRAGDAVSRGDVRDRREQKAEEQREKAEEQRAREQEKAEEKREKAEEKRAREQDKAEEKRARDAERDRDKARGEDKGDDDRGQGKGDDKKKDKDKDQDKGHDHKNH